MLRTLYVCAGRLFERGLLYVGTDYLSHLLWDKYIEFENSQNEISRVAHLYTRILQLPIQQLDRFYSGFKNLAATHSLQELQSPEENEAAAMAAAGMQGLGDASATEPIGTLEGEGLPKPEQMWQDTSELEKFMEIRDSLYKAAKEQDGKIRDFETAIRRPYFHVKPLDDVQLANWHRYLDFIEKEGDFEKTVKLFERCLIACANYPEYWIRYVQRMDIEGSFEYASDALNRATQIFVKRRPEIHLFAARFKEFHGDMEGARAEYVLLNSGLAVGLVEAVIKAANFERRQGNIEGASSIFESAIELEKSKEESRTLPFLFIQYARFLDEVAFRIEKAREVMRTALELMPLSKMLWETAIHFESFHQGNKAVDYIDSLVEEATAPTRHDGSQVLSAADREEISSIFLEFVDFFGDTQAIHRAEARHRQLFPFRKSTAESKKRPSPDGNVSDRSKMLKPYATAQATTSPAQSGPPVYANGQTQWGGGYGPQAYAQPQSWQQAPPQPQVQSQQWNPGYSAQQGGYGAYGGYGTYGPPQQQAPPPQQQPTYGGYAQTYAPQAFAQQNYAQPAPAYNQQQAPAQQGYYGYY
eukprot:c28411_g1_i1 orf=1180-2937(+)